MASSNVKKATGSSATQKQHPQKRRSRILKKLFLFFVMLSLVGVAAISVGLAWYVNEISYSLPSEEEMLNYEANEASIVYDRNNRVIAELFVENRKPIKIEEISKWMLMSILAAEDSEFYSHKGIRPLAIARSILTGDRGQGASTITQQLARNLFLTNVKSLERKAKEAIISLRLERLYTKDKLLETYLNAIYFGHGTWGIDAAAHSYFNKNASELSLAESSILAGLVAAPEKYSPIRNMEASRSRQSYVLRRLVHLGWITEEEANQAANEPLKLNEKTVGNKLVLKKAPYFVSHILFKELIPEFGSDRVYKGGLKIYTTLDLDLQDAAEESIKNAKYECGLISIDPNTGAVLALVGGRDYNTSKFNRVTQAYRQPGSTFKPIVYTAALSEGYLPTDHILDTPITLKVKYSAEDWSPHNYGDKYAGEEILLSALAHSHNVPCVRLTVMLGPDKIVEVAKAMGITSPYLSPLLSVGLGTTNVTPLEMSIVYSVFANGGNRVTPYFIREIRNADGNIIFSALPKLSEAVKPDVAIMARSMLKEVVRAGTGANAKIPEYEVFGKTGTTNDSTDVWFAGGVPGLVSVVYLGNDDSKPLGKSATGSRVALPIWKNYMTKAVKILNPPKSFTDTGIDTEPVVICIASGYAASASCPKITKVYLPRDAVTTSPCPIHAGGSGDDPNAPRLLLLDQDAGKYEIQAVEEPEQAPEEQQTETQTEVSPTLPSVQPYKESEQPHPSTGSWRDYIKKDDRPVEERYQELLRKYHIK